MIFQQIFRIFSFHPPQKSLYKFCLQQQQQQDRFVNFTPVATVVPLQVRFCWGSGSFGGCHTGGIIGGAKTALGANAAGFAAGTVDLNTAGRTHCGHCGTAWHAVKKAMHEIRKTEMTISWLRTPLNWLWPSERESDAHFTHLAII